MALAYSCLFCNFAAFEVKKWTGWVERRTKEIWGVAARRRLSNLGTNSLFTKVGTKPSKLLYGLSIRNGTSATREGPKMARK